MFFFLSFKLKLKEILILLIVFTTKQSNIVEISIVLYQTHIKIKNESTRNCLK